MDEGVWIEVQQGESAESIAYRHGHFVDTVWNHPQNESLRKLRGDPHILQPGDRLFVPSICPGTRKVPTGAVHRFRRRGVPSRITLLLHIGNEPLADLPYRIELPGNVRTGRTDAEGRVSIPVMPDAGDGRIIIDPEGRNLTFPLAMRHLDPITEISGVQGRLRNLGYYAGEVDGSFSLPTLLAVQRFQFAHDLATTGTLDDETRRKLLEIHGC